MKTRPLTSATPSPGNVGAPPPLRGPWRMPARTAPGQALPVDPGAVEYASWLRLLRRPVP